MEKIRIMKKEELINEIENTSTTKCIKVLRQAQIPLQDLIIEILLKRELSENQLNQIYSITESPAVYRMLFYPGTT